MTETYAFPALDPDRNQLVAIFGRKGSGKSVLARELVRAWPAVDKIVIDPTGDADPGADLGTRTITTLPTTLEPPRKGHLVVRYVANAASPTYQEDLDRAIGLALFPKTRRRLLWIDEGGSVLPAGATGPNGRLLLHQGRHYWTSAVICAPRPIGLDTLVLSQADMVVMYDVPHPRDRDRLAAALGLTPKFLVEQLDQLRARGEHWFLVYVAREHALYLCPPFPMSGAGTAAQV